MGEGVDKDKLWIKRVCTECDGEMGLRRVIKQGL